MSESLFQLGSALRSSRSESQRGGGSAASSSSRLDTKKYLRGLTPETLHAAPLPPLSDSVTAENVPRDEFRTTPPTDLEEHFRHSGWAARRRRVFDSLQRTHQTSGRIDSFACCGSYAVVQYSPARQRYRARGNYCHDRLCVPCARGRAARAAAAITSRVTMDRIRLVSFTVRHTADESLRDQILRVKTAWSDLRKHPLWRAAVTGGCVCMEVTHGDLHGWHVHLHCITEGTWIDSVALRAAWFSLVGSGNIDIASAPSSDPSSLAKYVSHYVTTGTDSSVVSDDDRLDEYVAAIKGVHLIDMLGSWRRWQSEADAEDEAQADDWVHVGRLHWLILRAQRGDPIAAFILLGRDSEPARLWRLNLSSG